MAFFRVIKVRVGHDCEECFEPIAKGEMAVTYYRRPLSQQHGLIHSEYVFYHIHCFEKHYQDTLSPDEISLLRGQEV